jgi:hypothetical protein
MEFNDDIWGVIKSFLLPPCGEHVVVLQIGSKRTQLVSAIVDQGSVKHVLGRSLIQRGHEHRHHSIVYATTIIIPRTPVGSPRSFIAHGELGKGKIVKINPRKVDKFFLPKSGPIIPRQRGRFLFLEENKYRILKVKYQKFDILRCVNAFAILEYYAHEIK